MREAAGDIPPPDPGLHQTGNEGLDGQRGLRELRLLEHFGMRPSSDILDVGCGIGRLAHACATYLEDDATYTGLDIAPAAIDWLNENYAPLLPGFRFDLLDVHSPRYRPDAEVGPEEVRFPYQEHSFDVVCAFEVFMHLSLDGVRNYLHEIARVLRPGGLAVVTLVAIYPGEPLPHNAPHPYVAIADGVYTKYPRRTSMSMAYDVGMVRSLVAEAKLEEVDLIRGLIHTPADDRPGIDHIRRERREKHRPQQIDLKIAAAAREGIDLLAGRQAPSPGPKPEAPELPRPPIDPLVHPCDVLACLKPAARP